MSQFMDEQRKRQQQRREALYRTLGRNQDGTPGPTVGFQPNPNAAQEYYQSVKPTTPTVNTPSPSLNTNTHPAPKDPSKKPNLLDTLKTVGTGVQSVAGGLVGLGPKGDKWGIWDGVQDFNVKANKSFEAGVGDVVKGVGQTSQWIGSKNDSAALQKFGQKTTDFAEKELIQPYQQQYSKDFTWKSLFDPEFYATDVARSAPFMLSMMIPGAGGASLAAKGVSMIPRVAKMGMFGKTVVQAAASGLGGAALTVPFEAAFEAGDVYHQALAKGMTEEEADQAANGVFTKNMGLLGVSNAAEFATMFLPGTKGGLKGVISKVGKIAGTAAMEGGQEMAQETISAHALGEKVNRQDLLKSGAIGGIMGGGMAAVLDGHEGEHDPIESIRANVRSRMSDEQKAQMDQLREHLKQQGYQPEEIENEVDKAFAETEEGQLIITEETQRILKSLEQEQEVNHPQPEQTATTPEQGSTEGNDHQQPSSTQPQPSDRQNLHDAMLGAVVGTAKKQLENQTYQQAKHQILTTGNMEVKGLDDEVMGQVIDRMIEEGELTPEQALGLEALSPKTPSLSENEIDNIIGELKNRGRFANETTPSGKLSLEEVDPLSSTSSKEQEQKNNANPEFGYADPFADEFQPNVEQPTIDEPKSVPQQRREEHEKVRKAKADKEIADKVLGLIDKKFANDYNGFEPGFTGTEFKVGDTVYSGDGEFTITSTDDDKYTVQSKTNKKDTSHHPFKLPLQDRSLFSTKEEAARVGKAWRERAEQERQDFISGKKKPDNSMLDVMGLADEEKTQEEPQETFVSSAEKTKAHYSKMSDEEILDEVAYKWIGEGRKGEIETHLKNGDKEAAFRVFKEITQNSGSGSPGGVGYSGFSGKLKVHTYDGRSWNLTQKALFNRYVKLLESGYQPKAKDTNMTQADHEYAAKYMAEHYGFQVGDIVTYFNPGSKGHRKDTEYGEVVGVIKDYEFLGSATPVPRVQITFPSAIFGTNDLWHDVKNVKHATLEELKAKVEEANRTFEPPAQWTDERKGNARKELDDFIHYVNQLSETPQTKQENDVVKTSGEEPNPQQSKEEKPSESNVSKPKAPEGFQNGFAFEDFQKGEKVSFFMTWVPSDGPVFVSGKITEMEKAKNANGEDWIRNIHAGNLNLSKFYPNAPKGMEHHFSASQISTNIYKETKPKTGKITEETPKAKALVEEQEKTPLNQIDDRYMKVFVNTKKGNRLEVTFKTELPKAVEEKLKEFKFQYNKASFYFAGTNPERLSLLTMINHFMNRPLSSFDVKALKTEVEDYHKSNADMESGFRIPRELYYYKDDYLLRDTFMDGMTIDGKNKNDEYSRFTGHQRTKIDSFKINEIPPQHIMSLGYLTDTLENDLALLGSLSRGDISDVAVSEERPSKIPTEPKKDEPKKDEPKFDRNKAMKEHLSTFHQNDKVTIEGALGGEILAYIANDNFEKTVQLIPIGKDGKEGSYPMTYDADDSTLFTLKMVEPFKPSFPLGTMVKTKEHGNATVWQNSRDGKTLTLKLDRGNKIIENYPIGSVTKIEHPNLGLVDEEVKNSATKANDTQKYGNIPDWNEYTQKHNLGPIFQDPNTLSEDDVIDMVENWSDSYLSFADEKQRKAYLKYAEKLYNAYNKRWKAEQEAKKQEKRKDKVVTAAGTEIEVEYDIVEADQVIPSHTLNGGVNPDFPKELQPRFRDAADSKLQIAEMAKNLDPQRLGKSRMASDGAPIIGVDSVVESGNGRTLAIMEMYERFTDEKEMEYREFLNQFAEEHLLEVDPNDLARPMLVRVRLTDVNREKFVAEANDSGVSRMGTTEKALADAKKLGAFIDLFVPSESGEVNTPHNQEFVRKFINEVVPASDRREVRTAEGYLSQDGKERLEHALFALAFNDRAAIERYAEELDDNARTVTGAMVDVAPKMAILNTDIEKGVILPEFNISRDVVDAFKKLVELRRQGHNIKKWIEEDRKQESLFEDTKLSEIAYELLAQFDSMKSRKKIRAILFNYVEYVLADPRSKGEDLFGDRATKGEFLQIAIERVNGGGDLFELEAQTRPSETPNASKKPGTEEASEKGNVEGKPSKVILPLPENPENVKPQHYKEYVEAMKNLVGNYRSALIRKELPTTQSGLRKMATEVLGRATHEEEWSDALEAAIQMNHYQDKFKQRNQTTGEFTWTLPEAIERGQKLEGHLKNAGRSLEKTERQQFSTPIPLAEMVSLATHVKPGNTIRESSAGTGSLVSMFLGQPVEVFANELSPRRAAILEVVANEIENSNITVHNGDVFKLPNDTKYDVIVGNPPFIGENKGKGTAAFNGKPPWKGGWGDLGNRFLAWDLRSLKEGGRLVYIVSGGVIDGKQNADFRKWLKENHTVRVMVKFPSGVYDSRGTKFPTGLIVVDKGKTNEKTEPITGEYETLNDLLTALRPFYYPVKVGDVVTHKSQFDPWQAEILEFEPNFKHSGKVKYEALVRRVNGAEMNVDLQGFVPKEDEAAYIESKKGNVFPKNRNVPKDAPKMVEDWKKTEGLTPSSKETEQQEPPKNVQPSKKEQIQQKYDEIRNQEDWSSKAAAAARERLKKRHKGNTTLYSGLPVDDMIDFTIIGMDMLKKKVIDIAEFTEIFVADFGEDVRDWIDGIYYQSLAMTKFEPERIEKMLQKAYGDEDMKLFEEETVDEAAAFEKGDTIEHKVTGEKYQVYNIQKDGKFVLKDLKTLQEIVVGSKKMTEYELHFSPKTGYANEETKETPSMSAEEVKWAWKDLRDKLATSGKNSPQFRVKLLEEMKAFAETHGLEFSERYQKHLDDNRKMVQQKKDDKIEQKQKEKENADNQERMRKERAEKERAEKEDIEPGFQSFIHQRLSILDRYVLMSKAKKKSLVKKLEQRFKSSPSQQYIAVLDDSDLAWDTFGYSAKDSEQEVVDHVSERYYDGSKEFEYMIFTPDVLRKAAESNDVVSNESERTHSGARNTDENANLGGPKSERTPTTGNQKNVDRESHSGSKGVSSTGTVHDNETSPGIDGTSDRNASSFTSEQETVSANVPEQPKKSDRGDTTGAKGKGTDGPTVNHVPSPNGYVPGRVVTGVPHRGNVTEASNMKFVSLPEEIFKDDKYLPHPIVIEGGEWKLSDVQMESVMAAKYNFLERGKRGILIADDTGMGKTAQQLGIAADAWHSGRTKRILVVTTKDQVATSSFIPENEKLGFQLPITHIGPDSEYTKKHGTTFKDKAFHDAKDYLPFQVGDGIIVMSKYTFRDSQESVIQWLGESETDVTILMDESHEFANREAGLGKANVRMYERFKEKAQFIYSSATAAEDLDGLEHMYGLHLWDTGGFGQFKMRLSSTDPKAKAGKKKTGMAGAFERSGKSPFKREVPLTLMEQITRELKMEGQYIGRQLSMDGVAMEGLEVKLSPQEMGDWNRAVQFVGMIAAKAEMYGRSKDGEHNPKARGMITSQVVGYMKRLSGYYRLKAIIRDIQNQMDNGTFKRFGIMAEFKSGDDGEPANLFAAINAINDQDPVDTGDDIVYEDIPEALDDKKELLAILQGLNPEWGEKPIPELPSPMQLLFDAFGEDSVAVVSGDVKASDRPKVVKEFQNGKKPIIWFNAAGGTGVNMHDTIGVPIRVYTQDYPYNAKQQKQSEGRFNRTGQVTTPMYMYPYLNSATDTKFVGTLIARYEAMGALSRGDTAKLGGAELANFDFTGEAAEEAVFRTIPDIDAEDRANMFGEFTKDISYIQQDGALDYTSVASTFSGNAPEVKKFLNALMFLEFDSSKRVFEIFQEKMGEIERELEEKGGVKDKFNTYSGVQMDMQVGKSGIKLRKVKTVLTEQQKKQLDQALADSIALEEEMATNYEKVKDETLKKLEGQVEDIERKQQEENEKQKELESKSHDIRRKMHLGEINGTDYQKHMAKIATLQGEIRRRDDRLREVKGKLKGLKDGKDDVIDTIAETKLAKTRKENARLFRMGMETEIERSEDVLLVDGRIATNGLLVNIRDAIRKAAKKIYGEKIPTQALTLELRGYNLDSGERAVGAVVPKWAEKEVAEALEARMAYTGGESDIEEIKAFLKTGNKVSLQNGYELEWQPKLRKFRIAGMTVSKDRDLFKSLNKDGPVIGFDPVSKSFVIEKDEGFQKFIERFPILEKKNLNSPPEKPKGPSEPSGPSTLPGTRTIKGLKVEVKTSKHTQTGEPIWLVKVIDRIENYGEFAGFMKRYGGTYYSAKTKIREFAGHFVFTKDPEPVFDRNMETVLNERINEYTTDGKEGGFFSFGGGAASTRKYSFEDPTIQQRIDDAQEIQGEAFTKKMMEWLERQSRQWTREFEHLPNTKEFSEIRHRLLQLEKQRTVSMEKTAKNLHSLLIKLDREQYELFRNVVLVSDLMQEKAIGHELAFGFTEDSLEHEYNRMMGFLAGESEVQISIDLRKQLWDDIKNQYVKAFDKIGVNVKDKFSKEDYYRHIIIQKTKENQSQKLGGTKKLKTPKGKGYMKQRHGSELDYVTDYLHAESEVMANMLFDIEVAKTIGLVDDRYNMENQVKKMTEDANNQSFQNLIKIEEEGIKRGSELQAQGLDEDQIDEQLEREGLGLPERYKKVIEGFIKEYKLRLGQNRTTDIEGVLKAIKGRVGWAYAELKKLAEADTLWKGKDDEYAYLVDDLAQGANNVDKYDWFEYLSDLATQAEEGAPWAGMYLKYHRLPETFKRELLGDDYKTMMDFIPEGYTVWRPDDSNVFFMTNTLPDYLAERLFNGTLDSLTEGDFTKQLVMAGKRKGFIIKEELAATLEHLMEPPKFSTMRNLTQRLKSLLLIGPINLFKYNARNMTGDLDKTIAGNPHGLHPKIVAKAFSELNNVFIYNRAPGADMKAWLERGGLQTLIQSTEFGDMKHLHVFRDKIIQKELNALQKVTKVPKNLWDFYWNNARRITDYREALLRYSNFLSYLEQVDKGKGKPKNYGASLRQEIDGLSNHYDKAFNLSNDLLIAYDKTSVKGKQMRDTLLPFFSFIEGNMRSYIRLFKNAYHDEQIASAVGRKLIGTLAIKSPVLAYRTGKLAMKVAFLSGLLALWNALLFGDEEDELPEDVQKSVHIVLGRNNKGEVRYFSRLGTLEDFMGWFGLDDIDEDMKSFLNNEKTFTEILGANTIKPVNKVIQAVSPFLKQATEQITGLKLFPDFMEPSRIYDRWEHFASMFGFQKEYAALRDEVIGRPHKEHQFFRNTFAYYSDIDETNYYHVRDEAGKAAEKYLNKKGGLLLGKRSEKSEILYEVKVGLKYGDMDYAEANLQKYFAAGGNNKGLLQSLNSLHPLYVIPQDLRQNYYDSLSEEEQNRVERAVEYFEKILLADTGVLNK